MISIRECREQLGQAAHQLLGLHPLDNDREVLWSMRYAVVWSIGAVFPFLRWIFEEHQPLKQS